MIWWNENIMYSASKSGEQDFIATGTSGIQITMDWLVVGMICTDVQNEIVEICIRDEEEKYLVSL